MYNEKLMPQRNVEGFDPRNALTIIEDIDSNGQPVVKNYFPVNTSMEWFLTVYPNACFNHTIQVNDRKAIATASIYRDINDARPASMATCTKLFTQDEAGVFYEQNAVTSAYRKALEYLGFGISAVTSIGETMSNENGEGVSMFTTPVGRTSTHNLSNQSPVEEKTTTANVEPEKKPKGTRKRKVEVEEEMSQTDNTPIKEPVTTPESSPVQETQKQEKSPVILPVSATNAIVDIENVGDEELPDEDNGQLSMASNMQTQPSATQSNTLNSATETNTKTVNTDSSVISVTNTNSSTEEMTFEKAKEFILTVGQFAGHTIADVAQEKGMDYIQYFYKYLKEQRKEKGDIVTALEIFIEFGGC